MIAFQSATDDQREQLLGMVLAQVGSDSQSAFEYLGVSQEDFVRLYHSTGEVRAVNQGNQLAGFVWIEHRDGKLHIHGIILFSECRGLGVGEQVVDALACEFSQVANCIELGVQTSNERALRFYKRVGFDSVDAQLPAGFAVLRRSINGA